MSSRAISLRELRAACPENVAILPTAASRQVHQRWNKASRAARSELRERYGARFPYTLPGIRAAMRDAQLILKLEESPELAMILAVWKALPTDTRDEAEKSLRLMALAGGPAEQALAVVKRRSIGEQVDLDAALNRLRERAQ